MTSILCDKSGAALLESVLHREIPATLALELRVTSLTEGRIRLVAPVGQSNVNIHGTAFAGSIYSISAVAAWGLAYHTLQGAKAEANLVIAEGHIHYQRPIMGDIIAETCLSKEQVDAFVTSLDRTGKAELIVDVEVSDNTALRAVNTIKLVALRPKKTVVNTWF